MSGLTDSVPLVGCTSKDKGVSVDSQAVKGWGSPVAEYRGTGMYDTVSFAASICRQAYGHMSKKACLCRCFSVSLCSHFEYAVGKGWCWMAPHRQVNQHTLAAVYMVFSRAFRARLVYLKPLVSSHAWVYGHASAMGCQ